MDELQLPLNGDTLVMLAIGIFLPLVVTAFTKWDAPDWVKNIANLLFSIVAASAQQAIDSMANDDPFTWKGWISGVVITWLISAYAYMKLWRNTPINAAIGRATAGVGLNGPVVVQPTVEPPHGTTSTVSSYSPPDPTEH